MNPEYDEPAMVAVTKEFRQLTQPADGERPGVVARKGYFGYFANARTVLMPFTDLDGLQRFMDINEVDYLFVESRLVSRYPFMAELDPAAPDSPFETMISRVDPRGGQLILLERRRQDMADNREPLR